MFSLAMEPKSDNFPTRSSLLRRVKDTEDRQSWREFHDIYRKLIFAFARKAGLTEDEADEVVQETMIAVARHLPEFHYDPGVCSFKTWLLNVTRWRVNDQLRRRASQSGAPAPRSGETSSAEIERFPSPGQDPFEAAWDSEWRGAWLQAALTAVKAETDPKQWQIFDLYVLKEWTPGDVARTLKISIARVYLAKPRVSSVLKKEIKRLQRLAEYPPRPSDGADPFAGLVFANNALYGTAFAGGASAVTMQLGSKRLRSRFFRKAGSEGRA